MGELDTEAALEQVTIPTPGNPMLTTPNPGNPMLTTPNPGNPMLVTPTQEIQC